MLCENLLKISLLANIEAAQFATVERIVEFIEGFKPLDFKKYPDLGEAV